MTLNESHRAYWPVELRGEELDSESEPLIATPPRFRKESSQRSTLPPAVDVDVGGTGKGGMSGRALWGCLVALVILLAFLVMLFVFARRGFEWIMGQVDIPTLPPVEQVEVMQPPAPVTPPFIPPPTTYTPPVYDPPPVVTAPPETIWMQPAVPVETRDSTRVERKSDERVVIRFPDGETFDISAELGNIFNSVEITEEVLED